MKRRLKRIHLIGGDHATITIPVRVTNGPGFARAANEVDHVITIRLGAKYNGDVSATIERPRP